MIIKYKNEDSGAPDEFIGIESCCHKMMMMVMSNRQVSITNRGYALLLPSEREIRFCPFCGKKIMRVDILA